MFFTNFLPIFTCSLSTFDQNLSMSCQESLGACLLKQVCIFSTIGIQYMKLGQPLLLLTVVDGNFGRWHLVSTVKNLNPIEHAFESFAEVQVFKSSHGITDQLIKCEI